MLFLVDRFCGGSEGDRDRIERDGDEEQMDGVALRSERGEDGADADEDEVVVLLLLLFLAGVSLIVIASQARARQVVGWWLPRLLRSEEVIGCSGCAKGGRTLINQGRLEVVVAFNAAFSFSCRRQAGVCAS